MGQYKITVAPNGARRQKTDHPALPVTNEEIAATAAACFAAGADEIHLHVREDDGSHSLDPGRYRDAIAAVSDSAPGMTIQITTESAGKYGVADQLACLHDLEPVAASIAVREMARDEGLARKVYELTDAAGTKVQHILYTTDCIAKLLRWREEGIVRANQSDVIFVLGQYGPEVLAQPGDLAKYLAAIEGQQLSWTACAFGRHEQACLLQAIQEGGNVRIGFENNIETPEGDLLKDNESSVAAFVAAAKALNIQREEI